MSSLMHESELKHEVEVVWLEDPETFDYVRQALDKTHRKRNRPRYARDGRMVGYSELDEATDPDPDSGLYRRRVFFLLPHDRDTDPHGLYREGAPGEAVDPRTIEPRRVGEKTPRSQCGPEPDAPTGSPSAGRGEATATEPVA